MKFKFVEKYQNSNNKIGDNYFTKIIPHSIFICGWGICYRFKPTKKVIEFLHYTNYRSMLVALALVEISLLNYFSRPIIRYSVNGFTDNFIENKKDTEDLILSFMDHII